MSSSESSDSDECDEELKRIKTMSRRFFEQSERSSSDDSDTIRMENERSWEEEKAFLNQSVSTSPLPELIVERVPTRKPPPFEETQAYYDILLSEMKEYIKKSNLNLVTKPADKDNENKNGNEEQTLELEPDDDNLEEDQETDGVAQEWLETEQSYEDEQNQQDDGNPEDDQNDQEEINSEPEYESNQIDDQEVRRVATADSLHSVSKRYQDDSDENVDETSTFSSLRRQKRRRYSYRPPESEPSFSKPKTDQINKAAEECLEEERQLQENDENEKAEEHLIEDTEQNQESDGNPEDDQNYQEEIDSEPEYESNQIDDQQVRRVATADSLHSVSKRYHDDSDENVEETSFLRRQKRRRYSYRAAEECLEEERQLQENDENEKAEEHLIEDTEQNQESHGNPEDDQNYQEEIDSEPEYESNQIDDQQVRRVATADSLHSVSKRYHDDSDENVEETSFLRRQKRRRYSYRPPESEPSFSKPKTDQINKAAEERLEEERQLQENDENEKAEEHLIEDTEQNQESDGYPEDD